MSVGLIILFIFIIFLIYLLVAPVTLKIDSYSNKYYFRIPGVLGFRIKRRKDKWEAGYSVFFIKFRINLYKIGSKTKKTKETIQPTDRYKRKKGFKPSYIKFGLNILSSFSLRKLSVEIDTGDFPLNAQLIPLAYALSDRRINLSVNFNDYNNIYFVVYTRIFKILYAIIRHFMFNK